MSLTGKFRLRRGAFGRLILQVEELVHGTVADNMYLDEGKFRMVDRAELMSCWRDADIDDLKDLDLGFLGI